MMIIVTGENQPIRVQIGLPFAVAAGFLICYERMGDFPNQRICLAGEIIVGVIILVFAGKQFKTSSEIEYGGEVIKRSDVLLANEIYHDVDAVVGDFSQYQLVIVGQNEVALPGSAKLGSITGKSIFNFLSSVEPYYLNSTQYVECIWKAEGKKSFGNTTKESAEAAVSYVENNEMGIFPENKSIVVLDNLVIVKISEDYYHY